MVLFPSDRACARREDPETSWKAAKSIQAEKIRESQMMILRVLRFGAFTDEEIYGQIPMGTMSPSGARTRRKELVDQGFVIDSGQRKRTRAGRKTIVWTLDR